MRYPMSQSRADRSGVAISSFVRFRRDKQGTTAIEFGMVALPFLMFAFGIMGTGLHFFTQNSLEHAVETSARKIRTGQAQQNGTTVSQFKQMIVDEAGPMIDVSKLQVHLQTGAEWTDVTPQGCLDNTGTQTNGTGNSGDAIGQHAGGAGEVVMVTVCYEWDLAKAMPFLQYGNMGNGSAMIQASTTFRTEPYE
ncbi:MAG: pilus assembly protein [Alphaproteobacteria bacterium]|nr:pilus assembly protein [Alphaproteobacteria bacterium]